MQNNRQNLGGNWGRGIMMQALYSSRPLHLRRLHSIRNNLVCKLRVLASAIPNNLIIISDVTLLIYTIKLTKMMLNLRIKLVVVCT